MLLAEKEHQSKNRQLFKSSYCRDYLDYVCVDESGKILRPNYVTEHFGWVIRKYGLRKIRFHDVRHSSTKFDKFTGYYYFPRYFACIFAVIVILYQ